MTTTQTHPDFLRTLSRVQLAWLAANRIEAVDGDRGYGFFFQKGDAWIEPVAATDSDVTLYTRDSSEDGDGARVVATFPRLRDALRALAGSR